MRQVLIAARRACGKTQQRVADEAGISRAYYTNVEMGDRTPSLEVARRIALAVGKPGDMGLFAPSSVSKRHNSKQEVQHGA